MISVSIVVRPPFTVWSYRYGDVPGPPPYTVQIQSEDAEIADRPGFADRHGFWPAWSAWARIALISRSPSSRAESL
jgi:hypothetical protein